MFLELGVRVHSFNNSSMITKCPKGCICTADLLSCARTNLSQVPVPLPSTTTSLDLSHNLITQLDDHWLATLPRLQTLRISHNQINDFSRHVFQNATYLVHLDLSSNCLHAVKEYYFENLVKLEELLLYNNKILEVQENVLVKLTSLQKIYLSWNRLNKFPFRSLQGLGYPHLRMIDLSNNNLRHIPVKIIAALPDDIKKGLYFHNNSVECGCPLHQMLQEWKHRGFSSVQDFTEEHICKAYDTPWSLIHTLNYGEYVECPQNQEELDIPNVSCQVGDSLVINCNTSLHDDTTTTYRWISPRHKLFMYTKHRDGTHQVLRNGSLKITDASHWHSGIYVCIAISELQKINSTYEVNVTVNDTKPAESFKTAFTTLLGCLVSLVLVLMYLYLTPCHCSKCCKKPGSPPPDCSAQSSILSTTPPATDGPNRKIGTSKHVAFLEPIKEAQNGTLKLAVSEDIPDANPPKLLHLKLDTGSISSVFSDAPIISYVAGEMSPADGQYPRRMQSIGAEGL